MSVAFDILAEHYRPMLAAYARVLMKGHEHDADDLVQETLVAAHRSLESFRPEEHFGAWLRGIARNKARESHRAARSRRAIVDSRVIEGVESVYALLDAPAPGEERWQDRARRILAQCVERLNQNLREAIVRVYQEDMSLREAAETLQSSPAAIGQRLTRARQLIRKCVETHAEDRHER